MAVSVFPGLSILAPRLVSRVTLAVRAGAMARDVIYPSIYLPLLPCPAGGDGRRFCLGSGENCSSSAWPEA